MLRLIILIQSIHSVPTCSDTRTRAEHISQHQPRVNMSSCASLRNKLVFHPCQCTYRLSQFSSYVIYLASGRDVIHHVKTARHCVLRQATQVPITQFCVPNSNGLNSKIRVPDIDASLFIHDKWKRLRLEKDKEKICTDIKLLKSLPKDENDFDSIRYDNLTSLYIQK